MNVSQHPMRVVFIVATLCFTAASIHAQTDAADAEDQQKEKKEDWPSPRVSNMIPRGILASYTPVMAYSIKSKSHVDGLPNDEAHVKRLDKLLFKIKFPVLLRDRTNIVIGLDYAQDEYNFDGEDAQEYALYKSLQNKRMKSRVMKFYYDHALDKKHWLYIRASAALNGDVEKLNLSIYEFAKYTMAVFYGKQQSENNSYGIGLYMSYDLGRPAIYPAIVWNKTLNAHWGFESKFPATFKWRYNVNKKQRLFAGYEVAGASYNVKLDDQQLARYTDMQLRRSDVFTSLTYERAIISDFIWAGVTAGWRYNYKFNISENNSFHKNDPLIENDVSSSLYVNFSVFFTPSETIKRIFLDE